MDFKKIFNEPRSIFTIITKVLWIVGLSLILLLPIFLFTVSIDAFGLYGGMPSLKALENPENDLSSELITSDGVSLGRYWRSYRSQTTYDELSPALINTLLDSEDHRFEDHPGIDLRGLARAVAGVLTFQYAGGGSTITMQLAENLFKTMSENEGLLYNVPGVRSVVIKTKEWIIAAKLERNFTKKEIFAMYLNTVSFGSNAFGIKTASETFFGKSPAELNYQESAVLIGLLQGTTAFNPVRNYDRSMAKRNQVLRKINRHNHISDEEFDSLKSLPIDLTSYSVANQNKGLATYFRTVIKRDLLNWCEENGYDLYEDGLKIYTSIDSRMQKYAEEAVAEHMTKLQAQFFEHWKGREPWIDPETGRLIPNFLERRFKLTHHYKNLAKKYGVDSDSLKIMMNKPRKMSIFTWEGEKDTVFSPLDSVKYYKHFLHTGMMSMDPHTGQIKAWVGGINHKAFKYDHVRQGKRQPGSTFKPFVYGTAIEQGYPPCYEVQDVVVTFNLPEGGTWSTPNAEGDYGSGEKMTIRQGMAKSVNTVTSYLMREVKPQNVVDFAHRVGINSHLDAVPALCLGVNDVSVYELVGAYSTFANGGIYTKPNYLLKIEDKNGNVIQNFVPDTKQAISQQTAYKMLYMLRGGVEEKGGTSIGLARELKIDNEIGGKTGTTNNASDGWYMGVTKDLVTGVWVGGDERSIHFRNWYLGQGAFTARPIWEKYMLKVYEDDSLGYEKSRFQRPPGGLDVSLDCSRYGQTSESDSVEVDEQTPWDINDIQ